MTTKTTLGALSKLENFKFVESTQVPGQVGIVVLNPDGSNVGSSASTDGAASNALPADSLPSGSTSYSYFDMAKEGWKHLTAVYQLQNTTLTLEATNYASPDSALEPLIGDKLLGTATATDGTGATLTSTDIDLYGDDALNGLTLKVTADTTTPANVGVIRRIQDYVSATGVVTFNTAFPGAITSGVTQFEVIDTDPSLITGAWGQVYVSDAKAFWVDVTLSLAFVPSITDPSGALIVDTAVCFSRMRFKKVTTGTPNYAIVEITRGR